MSPVMIFDIVFIEQFNPRATVRERKFSCVLGDGAAAAAAAATAFQRFASCMSFRGIIPRKMEPSRESVKEDSEQRNM